VSLYHDLKQASFRIVRTVRERNLIHEAGIEMHRVKRGNRPRAGCLHVTMAPGWAVLIARFCPGDLLHARNSLLHRKALLTAIALQDWWGKEAP